METPPAASGQWGTVVWAVEVSGKTLACDFFNSLESKERAKVQAVFNRLANFGRIKTQERFKKLETRNGWALWEFKSFQLRFIGAFSPGVRKEFVVAYGLQKKKNRHNSADLDRAVRILNSHFTHQRPKGRNNGCE